VLTTTRRATKKGMRLPTLSEKTEVETVMPVSLAWLETWEILEGHPEGRHRFRAPWRPASTLTSRLEGLSDAAPLRCQASSHGNVADGWILV